MKRNEIDSDILIAELVRANTDALTAITGQLSQILAVALEASAGRTPDHASTRKVAVSQELLQELKGRPPGVRNG